MAVYDKRAHCLIISLIGIVLFIGIINLHQFVKSFEQPIHDQQTQADWTKYRRMEDGVHLRNIIRGKIWKASEKHDKSKHVHKSLDHPITKGITYGAMTFQTLGPLSLVETTSRSTTEAPIVSKPFWKQEMIPDTSEPAPKHLKRAILLVFRQRITALMRDEKMDRPRRNQLMSMICRYLLRT